ncbi:MAG: signal transduction histidine kinase, partial [bacterium]
MKNIWQGNEKLAKEIVSRFPHPARIYALEDLFPTWANACLEGRVDEAWRFLEIARVIGLTLVDIHNDHQIKDSLSAIVANLEVSFLNNSNLLILTDRQHKLAIAHSFCKNGREFYREYQLEKALSLFVKAQNIFAELNDTSSHLTTTFFLARCQLEQFNYVKAFDLLNKILLTAEKNNYPNLLGLCWYSLGTIQLYQLELSQALLSQKSALKYLKQIDDTENMAMANILITGILERVGDKNKIWFYQYQALVSFAQFPKSVKQMRILLGSTLSLSKLGETRSALCFINQQIRVATESNDHLFLSTSFFYRSQINYQLNNTTEALLDLDKAKEYLKLIPNPIYQKRTSQEIEIIESSYKLKTDPKIVVEKLNSIIETNGNTLDRYHFTSIYYSRALAYISLGEYKKAELDLETSIKEIERERKIIDNEEHKITFFQKPQKTYETMIELQAIFQKNAILAFNYTEDARARALLDSFSTKLLNPINSELNKSYKANSLPLKLAEIQDKLPENTAIIEYKMLNNYLLIWV